MNASIFKTYDIRGIYPTEINEQNVFKIAQALARVLKPKTIALGRDVRLSSPQLWEAAKEGLLKAGVRVIDIGTISTDMLYFAVAHFGLDGGITITASHNPKEYNGMKIVGKNSAPIFQDYLLPEIEKIATDPNFIADNLPGGELQKLDVLTEYIQKVRSFIDLKNFSPTKILINANFGLAGQIFKKILVTAPIEWVELNCEPDGNFPKGRPDPLIPESREETKKTIREQGANIGFAWDADADRCFIYDENGQDIEGCFMGALLAKIILQKNFDSEPRIVYDPRIVWTLAETIKKFGGVPIPSKVGHAVIKSSMRQENALAALESSGHFYFRDFFFCDNGMISALLILDYLNKEKIKLSEALASFTDKYFVSGEINFVAENKDEIIEEIKQKYNDGQFEEIDGLSIAYSDWRFNLRKSNTEPLLRLNIETRKAGLLEEKREELVRLIETLRIPR